MKEVQRGLNTSQMRPASSRLRTRGSYFASLTPVRSNSPRNRGCALEKTDSVITVICKLHVAWPVCCSQGRNSSGRIRVSARDVGDGDRGKEAEWGRVPKGRDFATKSQVGRRASFLPFASPGTRPARAPPPEPRAWGTSTRPFRKPDSMPQHVKAHGSLPSRRPSHASQGACYSPGARSHQTFLSRNYFPAFQIFEKNFKIKTIFSRIYFQAVKNKKQKTISKCHCGLNIAK